MKTIPKVILDLVAGDGIASPLVPLLDFAMPDETHLRVARYTSDITYAGHDYTAWPFAAQLMVGSKANAVQTATLTIEDAVRQLRPYAVASNWFRNCTLTIAVVCVDHLTVDYSWSTQTYDILHAAPQNEAIALKLGGPNPTKMRFPAERYWAEQCPYARGFKDDPRCGYSGGETTCDGTLERCIELNNETHFGGFLGLDPDAAKLVLPMGMRVVP